MPRPTTAVKATAIRHRDGCPAERTEEHDATTPKGRRVRISRCVDCGEQAAATNRHAPADDAEDDQEEES